MFDISNISFSQTFTCASKIKRETFINQKKKHLFLINSQSWVSVNRLSHSPFLTSKVVKWPTCLIEMPEGWGRECDAFCYVWGNYFSFQYISTDVTPPVFMRCPSDIRVSLNVNSITANWHRHWQLFRHTSSIKRPLLSTLHGMQVVTKKNAFFKVVVEVS